MVRARIGPWFGALLAAAVALGAFGLRGLAREAERVDEGLQRQSSALARSLADAFQSLADDPGALERVRIACDAEGTWAGAMRARAGSSDQRVQRTTVDRLERAGDVPQALARLDEWALRESEPDLAAWALSTSAALRARAGDGGDLERARDDWRRIIERFPDSLDERGLPRAFAARFELLRTQQAASERVRDLADLAADLSAARTHVEDLATAALLSRTLDELRAHDPERADEIARTDRERSFERALRSSWTSGISNWIAAGAPGGSAWFELAPDPMDPDPTPLRARVHVERAQGDDAIAQDWTGWAVSRRQLLRAALGRAEPASWREAGFAFAFCDAQGRDLVGAAAAQPPPDPTSVRLALDAPNGDVFVRAGSTDAAAARASARRRFAILGILAAAALAVAAVGAWLSVRGVQQEARLARQREQFVAAVTHELKAPLASIRLLAELLSNGDVGADKVREFGARTVREADRLSRLVGSVLEMARLERGATPSPRQDVALGELALETLRQFEPQALEARVALKLRPVDDDLRVLAHADALGSALFELLTNAVKYGPAGAVEVEVQRRGENAVLAVLDRGPGVPPGERERIFEPFQRLGDEWVREAPGVGLGLALVRKVAESHGGSARCLERAGGGSRFELVLPLHAAGVRKSEGAA